MLLFKRCSAHGRRDGIRGSAFLSSHHLSANTNVYIPVLDLLGRNGLCPVGIINLKMWLLKNRAP